VTKRRDRTRRAARNRSTRDPKQIILVVCEGEVTEPEYFEAFKAHYRTSRVEVLTVKAAGVPFSLVTTARDMKRKAEAAALAGEDDNLRYDAVWAVFDVDDHPKINDAIGMARDNDIQLAISNPCFELWLLLHLRDQPGPQDRSSIRRLLTKEVGTYGKSVDFTLYQPGYTTAVKRARSLGSHSPSECKPGPNPSTEVCELTESIRTN
jgi:hypothetical protein